MGFGGDILSDSGHYEEFICPICNQLVDLQESLVTNCDHIFCLTCLEEWLKRKQSCPCCQNTDVSMATVKRLKVGNPLAWRVLGRVRIKCPLNCGWNGDYTELQSHLINNSSEHESTGASPEQIATSLKEQGNEKFAAKNFPDAIRLYSKAITVCNTIPQLYSNRAAVYMELRDYESAYSDASKAIELDPTFSKAYVRGAKALLQLGRFKEASEFLAPSDSSLKSEVQLILKYYNLALESLKAQDFTSLRRCTTNLMSKSLAPNVLLLGSRAELEVGSLERGLKLALQVLRANPKDPKAYAIRSLGMFYSSNLDEALKYIKESLRLHPDDEDAKSTFKRINGFRKTWKEAEALVSQRSYDQALALYDELEKENNTSPQHSSLRAQLYAERANAHFRLGNHQKALADCALAIYAQQDNRRAWLTKVYCLHAMEQHEQAVKDLEYLISNNWGQNDAVIRGAYDNAVFLVRKAKRPDYYGLLEVGQLASEPEIKAAYKKQALIYHPDRLVGTDATEKQRKDAEEKFKMLGEALEILTDSFKRKLYDQGFDKEAIQERVRRAEQGGHHHHH